MNVKEHYEKHLAQYYTWIYGGFESKANDSRAFFERNGITPSGSKSAIDLGCGPGFQSIPLSEMGFEVYAVDISRKLLDELSMHRTNHEIYIIESDFMIFDSYRGKNPELIVCMGDTLTHLESLNDVKNLLQNCHLELADNGKLILTFRDLTYELKGISRFIPVRSDGERIFTCFLEYFENHVDVFDIVNENKDGKWNQKIGFYKKLRLSDEFVNNCLKELDFKIITNELKNGMITIIAQKQ